MDVMTVPGVRDLSDRHCGNSASNLELRLGVGAIFSTRNWRYNGIKQ